MSIPRYLTASKISLLVLINLYCSSGIPSSATIPVLSFILSHSFPSAPSAARAPRSANHQDASLSIRAFEDVLQSHASNMPGRTLLDVFLKHMWEMNSLDSLFELFDRLGDLLARPQEGTTQDEPSGRTYLSQTSPMGVLVRRARVEFVRMQFDDAIKQWSAFIAYRAPTAQWTKRLAGLVSFGVDIVAADMGLDSSDNLYDVAYGRLPEEEYGGHGLSVDDLERLLDVQLDRLQRRSMFH